MAHEIFKQIRTGNIFSDTYFVGDGGRPSEYDIRRISNFVNSSLGCISLPKDILWDLDLYERYCSERARIWDSQISKKEKLTRTVNLEKKSGCYFD